MYNFIASLTQDLSRRSIPHARRTAHLHLVAWHIRKSTILETGNKVHEQVVYAKRFWMQWKYRSNCQRYHTINLAHILFKFPKWIFLYGYSHIPSSFLWWTNLQSIFRLINSVCRATPPRVLGFPHGVSGIATHRENQC